MCRLRDINGKAIYTYDGRDVVLKIQPRFPLSVVDMLNAIREDDEFERYLAPQTTRIGTSERDVEDLMCNEVFHFFSDEDPIYLHDEIAKESRGFGRVIAVSNLEPLTEEVRIWLIGESYKNNIKCCVLNLDSKNEQKGNLGGVLHAADTHTCEFYIIHLFF